MPNTRSGTVLLEWMTIVQRGFPTAEVRDFFAETAWIGFFDRLEAYFAPRSAG